MVFIVGREWLNVIAEIADRVWPSQDRFAFDYLLLHRSFISRPNSATENRHLGPAPKCLHIGRQQADVD
jgi:hypothetical protein